MLERDVCHATLCYTLHITCRCDAILYGWLNIPSPVSRNVQQLRVKPVNTLIIYLGGLWQFPEHHWVLISMEYHWVPLSNTKSALPWWRIAFHLDDHDKYQFLWPIMDNQWIIKNILLIHDIRYMFINFPTQQWIIGKMKDSENVTTNGDTNCDRKSELIKIVVTDHELDTVILEV